MEDQWWERPTCFVCDYGWIIAVVITLALILYFTRTSWMPLLGI